MKDSCVEGEDLASQEEFTKGICMRFGNRKDMAEEFNKLVRDKYMEEYVKRFEELKWLVNALNPSLPESYYIFSFINGSRMRSS